MSSQSKHNRVWYITGTSSGLGRTLLEEVLANGERAIGACRRTSSLNDLAQKYSNNLLVQSVDLTNEKQIKDSFAAGIAKWGRIDVVVNNAGYGLFGEIESVPEEDGRHNFEVQFWGPVRVLKEAVRVFREVNPQGEGGTVFSVSTIGGYRANPALSYYSASKFALEGFTQSFLQEMSPNWNIKGCILQPGGFDSEWRSSSKVPPPHPAYTDPNHPCAQFRSVIRLGIPYLGSVHKMAKTIVKLADMSKDGVELPLRVQLGTDSVFLVGQQAKNTLKDMEKWAAVSKETDADGMDGDQYVKNVLLASGNFEDAQER